MPTISPHVAERRLGSFLEMTVRATVNRHEPEIALHIIDSGRYYYISTTRTGIDGKVSRHKDLATATSKALKIVDQQFRQGVAAAKKRVTLYG